MRPDEGARGRIQERGVSIMAAEKDLQSKQGPDTTTMLISFLAGAAIGVGLILFAESKNSSSEESYGEADLFV